MISENPNFNYENLQKEIEKKAKIANLSPVISDKKIKKDRNVRIHLPNRTQAKKLIAQSLNKIEL
ncbi:MAG: hypothetical protein IJA89_04535 [Clostridia bacterium]|nr:hypothetical protein [Clostridia bacterium]